MTVRRSSMAQASRLSLAWTRRGSTSSRLLTQRRAKSPPPITTNAPTTSPRPVGLSRRQHDQLAHGAPTLRQVSQSAEDAEQRIDLDGVAMRVELTVVEGVQRQVVAGPQPECGRGDLLVRPELNGVTGRERGRMERTEHRLWIGRAELAGDPPQLLSARRANEEPTLPAVADDLQRHRLGRALSSRHECAEEVLRGAQAGGIGARRDNLEHVLGGARRMAVQAPHAGPGPVRVVRCTSASRSSRMGSRSAGAHAANGWPLEASTSSAASSGLSPMLATTCKKSLRNAVPASGATEAGRASSLIVDMTCL